MTVDDSSTTSVPIDRTGPPQSRFWPLHVYAALALGIGLPMLGRLQERKQFLASLETGTVIAFVLFWSVAVPLVVAGAIALCSLKSRRLAGIAVMAVIGSAASLLFLVVVSHRISGGGFGWLTLAACLGAGYAVAVLYRRTAWLQSLLAVAAIGALLGPISLISAYGRVSARPVIARNLQAGNPAPVVFIVFDCFNGMSLMDQNRQIDIHRYPRLAELAETSNWYRNCSSVHPRTDHAVPAILTGKLKVDPTTAPTVEQYPQNMFTLIGGTKDYELTVFEPFTSLCPPDRFRDRAAPQVGEQWRLVTRTVGAAFLGDVVPPDVATTPMIPRAWYGLAHSAGVNFNQRRGLILHSWDIRRDRQFHHFLDCIENTGRPNLWFGHFALPHFPWNYLPSGNHYVPDMGIRQEWGTEGQPAERWADDDLIVLQANQQHLLQTSYTDRLVGELLDRLREQKLFDQCLLVVMADHGVSFRPGISGRAPSDKNLADIMSVPLFIKLPGQTKGEVVDLNVETTDVLATVLDVLKLTPPTPVAGQSLIDPEFRERPLKVMADERRTFEVDASFEGRFEILAEQLAKFGSGEDPLRIFRIGPHANLLGKRIDDLMVAGESNITIQPLNFTSQVQYGSDPLVPVHLEAEIASKERPLQPVTFAIAVNDTVWGTTRTYRISYLRNFWRVMLPESAFRDGANSLRIFQIEESNGSMKLSECVIGPKGYPPSLPLD